MIEGVLVIVVIARLRGGAGRWIPPQDGLGTRLRRECVSTAPCSSLGGSGVQRVCVRVLAGNGGCRPEAGCDGAAARPGAHRLRLGQELVKCCRPACLAHGIHLRARGRIPITWSSVNGSGALGDTPPRAVMARPGRLEAPTTWIWVVAGASSRGLAAASAALGAGCELAVSLSLRRD